MKTLSHLVATAVISLSAIQAEDLLYVGLTDTGWQVFERSLETQKTTQLTKSLGDKRTPVYSSELAGIVYKGPRGRIWKVTDKGEESLLVDLEGCGDFSVDGSDIYFTRLVTGNPQRQQLWKAEGDYPTSKMQLVHRPETGSLRQVQSRAGRFIATHIWKPGEESVVVIDPAQSPIMQSISPQGEISAYPQWINDREVIYSQRDNEYNYDLYLATDNKGNLSDKPTIKQLTDTADYSEYSAVLNAAADTYFIERLGKDGKWSLATINQETGETKPIKTSHQAKEPALKN